MWHYSQILKITSSGCFKRGKETPFAEMRLRLRRMSLLNMWWMKREPFYRIRIQESFGSLRDFHCRNFDRRNSPRGCTDG